MYSLTVFEVSRVPLPASCIFCLGLFRMAIDFIWKCLSKMAVPSKYGDKGCFYCALLEKLLNGRLRVGEYDSLYTNWRINFLASLSTNYPQFQGLLEFLRNAFKSVTAFILFLWSEIRAWLPDTSYCKLQCKEGRQSCFYFSDVS